jgi:hypothetical protein
MKSTFFNLLSICFLLSLSYCSTPQETDKGFLRVDSNGRYFVFDDGTPYIPIGFNKFIFYEDDDQAIDSLLNLWSGHGVNYVRVWLGGGSDPEFPVGTFDEARMQKIDYILNKCEEYDVYVSLCLWNDNTLRFDVGYGWNNKRMGYNKAIDSLGTTLDPEDLKGVDHKPSLDAVLNRYTVFVNRWYHHKSLMMWDLVNDSKKTAEWKEQMYDHVRSLDPVNHIIGFQYNTGKDPKGEMDCGSVRVYEYNPGGNDPELMAEALFNRVLEALPHGDPVYCGEGRMHNGEAAEYEKERWFLQTLWGPIAVGSAGNLHAWVCPTKEGRWPDHTLQELKWMKTYSDFCHTINWSAFNSENMNESVSCSIDHVEAYACGDEKQMLVYLLNDDPEDEFKPVTTTLNFDISKKDPPYKLHWIDIRTGKVINTHVIETFPAEVDVPVFNDGILGHLINKN